MAAFRFFANLYFLQPQDVNKQTNKLFSLKKKKHFKILVFLRNWSWRYRTAETCYSMLRKRRIPLVTIITRSNDNSNGRKEVTSSISIARGSSQFNLLHYNSWTEMQPRIARMSYSDARVIAFPPTPLSVGKLTSTRSSECCIWIYSSENGFQERKIKHIAFSSDNE